MADPILEAFLEISHSAKYQQRKILPWQNHHNQLLLLQQKLQEAQQPKQQMKKLKEEKLKEEEKRSITFFQTMLEKQDKERKPISAERFPQRFFQRTSFDAPCRDYFWDQLHCKHFQKDKISTEMETREWMMEGLENIQQKAADNRADDIVNSGASDVLMNMNPKPGLLKRPRSVYDRMASQDLLSWNSLITRYAHHGKGLEALVCFQQMQLEGSFPDEVTLVCILKACGNIGEAKKGHEIHVKIENERLLKNNRIVGNSLVDMYAKCGLLEEAQEVFDELPVQDVISWTTLIAGYAQHSCGQEALNCYEQMQMKGILPNSLTFSCALKACGIVVAADKGYGIHAMIIEEGLLSKDIVLGNALVDMYAKCGNLPRAREVFGVLPKRDVVSWNALIAGYTQCGHYDEVFRCFDRLRWEGLSPSAVTYSSVLKACGSVGSAGKGESIHAQIAKDSLLHDHVSVGTALVDMYSKCGALWKAQEAFDELRVPSRASWNALITGYAQHGEDEDALHCFDKMQLAGFLPDKVTCLGVLQACGHMGAADMGQAMHARMTREGFVRDDPIVGTALVDMYANCGKLQEAREVFVKLPIRDVVSWSALIDGYAQLGEQDTVFDSFNEMIQEGKQPDSTILSILLNTCSHSGLLEKGGICFEIISTRYGIFPALQHYACMVDLYGRAGLLGQAIALIDRIALMPDSLMVWHSVLGACKKWEDVGIGRLAFDHATELDVDDVVAYVSMRNIYAASGMREEAEKIEGVAMKMEAWTSWDLV